MDTRIPTHEKNGRFMDLYMYSFRVRSGAGYFLLTLRSHQAEFGTDIRHLVSMYRLESSFVFHITNNPQMASVEKYHRLATLLSRLTFILMSWVVGSSAAHADTFASTCHVEVAWHSCINVTIREERMQREVRGFSQPTEWQDTGRACCVNLSK